MELFLFDELSITQLLRTRQKLFILGGPITIYRQPNNGIMRLIQAVDINQDHDFCNLKKLINIDMMQ